MYLALAYNFILSVTLLATSTIFELLSFTLKITLPVLFVIDADCSFLLYEIAKSTSLPGGASSTILLLLNQNTTEILIFYCLFKFNHYVIISI